MTVIIARTLTASSTRRASSRPLPERFCAFSSPSCARAAASARSPSAIAACAAAIASASRSRRGATVEPVAESESAIRSASFSAGPPSSDPPFSESPFSEAPFSDAPPSELASPETAAPSAAVPTDVESPEPPPSLAGCGSLPVGVSSGLLLASLSLSLTFNSKGQPGPPEYGDRPPLSSAVRPRVPDRMSRKAAIGERWESAHPARGPAGRRPDRGSGRTRRGCSKALPRPSGSERPRAPGGHRSPRRPRRSRPQGHPPEASPPRARPRSSSARVVRSDTNAAPRAARPQAPTPVGRRRVHRARPARLRPARAPATSRTCRRPATPRGRSRPDPGARWCGRPVARDPRRPAGVLGKARAPGLRIRRLPARQAPRSTSRATAPARRVWWALRAHRAAPQLLRDDRSSRSRGTAPPRGSRQRHHRAGASPWARGRAPSRTSRAPPGPPHNRRRPRRRGPCAAARPRAPRECRARRRPAAASCHRCFVAVRRQPQREARAVPQSRALDAPAVPFDRRGDGMQAEAVAATARPSGLEQMRDIRAVDPRAVVLDVDRDLVAQRLSREPQLAGPGAPRVLEQVVERPREQLTIAVDRHSDPGGDDLRTVSVGNR